METEVGITLIENFFKEKQFTFAENKRLKAKLFKYNSGVSGIKILNQNGFITLLPFQGQQVWSAEFDGKQLGMKSIFDEPIPTRDYLKTYGGFLLHCGLTSMGNPSTEDNHPLHGELPNAPYKEVQLIVGKDNKGNYMELKGKYHYKVAFSYNYIAEPSVRLYEDATTFYINMKFTNLLSKPLKYMYLMHINFNLVQEGEIISTVSDEADKVTIRKNSNHLKNEKYKKFIEEVIVSPSITNKISKDLLLDPELILFMNSKSCKEGCAHNLLCYPDGHAGYVKYNPSEFEHTIRWMVKTHEEQALGFSMPGTAQTDGYIEEQRKGNIKSLPPNESVKFSVETGVLRPIESEKMKEKIYQIKLQNDKRI